MSESEPATPTPRRGEVRLTLALWLALVAAMVPLLRVVSSGGWFPGAALLCALLLGCGFLLRRRRRVPAVGVTVAQVALWVAVIMLVFLPSAAFLGIFPTGAVVEAVPQLVRTAANEIAGGTAPLAPTSALSFVIVASVGLLAIALDHVVLTARMPLLAAVPLAVVWLIPSIAVPQGVDVVAFVTMAAAILFLLRAETRTRERAVGIRRGGGITAVAVAIGAVAITSALIGGPALPPPTSSAGGLGFAASIDASLDLGDDLRRPDNVPVLTMRSTAPTMPYLRVATLSVFNGTVWQPDNLRSVPLGEEPLEPVTAAEGVRIVEYRTNVQVTQLSSAYLPIPFPAVEVSGLVGEWNSVAYSRTLLTGQSNAQGQNYEVVTHVPKPTLEQIRDTRAANAPTAVDVTTVPAGTPAIVAETAREVTADATTDYDKLIALQSWFRGPAFTYSLQAPVEAGFDDTGVQAVAAFLDRKAGYCVHFAGAFALMARTLGMPSRIVVGFLPGTLTGDTVDDLRVAQVTTGQLHSWPEVYFQGIGWVGFEPTKSLGTPTNFVSASDPTRDVEPDVSAPSRAPTPQASTTGGPTERPDVPTDASGVGAQGIDLRPLLLPVSVALVILLAPAAAAWVRRRLLRRRGGPASAWRAVQDAAIDLGVPVRLSESPRAFGTRLVAWHGAPHAETGRLVRAMERVSYAPPEAAVGSRAGSGSADGDTLFADAEAIRRALRAEASTRERLQATLLPRSLVIRPGSAFADREASG